MRNYLVMWSGGIDSTYLIKYLLDRNKVDNVTAAYVIIKNNSNKTRMELAAIRQMIPYFVKQYGKRFQFYKDCNEVKHYGFQNVVLGQALIWVFYGLMIADVDYLALGYICGDDAVSYLDDARSMRKSMLGFCYRLPKLSFPLMKYSRVDTWNGLPEELRKLTVWCENPKISGKVEQCGRCVACIEHKMYKLKHGMVKDIKYLNDTSKNSRC